MKKTIILSLILFAGISSYGQSNESDPSLYTWKGKKTLSSPGYIVLKSGKQVNGELTLVGKPNALTQIILVENGKELKIPVSAVKAYGLGSVRGTANNGSSGGGGLSGPQCDHNPEQNIQRRSTQLSQR